MALCGLVGWQGDSGRGRVRFADMVARMAHENQQRRRGDVCCRVSEVGKRSWERTIFSFIRYDTDRLGGHSCLSGFL